MGNNKIRSILLEKWFLVGINKKFIFLLIKWRRPTKRGRENNMVYKNIYLVA